MYLQRGDRANFIGGLLIARQSHQVIQHDVVNHLIDFCLIPAPMRGFPRRRKHRIENFLQAGIRFIARVKLHQPLRTLRIEQKLQRVLRRGLCRRQRVERRISPNLKMFPPALVFGRPRWNQLQQGFRQRQRLRLQRGQHSGQCPPLLRRCDNLRRYLPISAQRKRVIHPADQFACSFHLVPVQHEDRH